MSGAKIVLACAEGAAKALAFVWPGLKITGNMAGWVETYHATTAVSASPAAIQP